MSLEERIDWLKNNKPSEYFEIFNGEWKQYVENNIVKDMYSFAFNHPYYGGDSGLTDDEARHKLLDDLDVPR